MLNYLQQVDNVKKGEAAPLRPELVINEKLKQALPATMYAHSTGKHSSVNGKKSLNWLNEKDGNGAASLTQHGSRGGTRRQHAQYPSVAANSTYKDQSDSILQRFQATQQQQVSKKNN